MNIGNLNSAASTRGTNDRNNVAFSDNQNQQAFATADATGINTIFFEPLVEFTFVQLSLNSPEVDNARIVTELPSSAIAPVDFDACPVNQSNLTPQTQLPKPIDTSIGKIYPARGITIEGNKIILTPYPTPNLTPGDRIPLNNCR